MVRAVIINVLAIFVLAVGASAAPPAASISGQSWESALDEIKRAHDGLSNAGQINDKLFNPATKEQETFKTMDGSQEFSASFLCQGQTEILRVAASPSANGELTVKISYDVRSMGSLTDHLVIENVAGACNAGAVYDCQPSGSWLGCKYGILEFEQSVLNISPNYPSGEPRPAAGMEGCFCFSNACGGTSTTYMSNILTHIGQGIANQIAAAKRNLIISGPFFEEGASSAVWLSGDISNCDGSSVSNLTDQMGKLEFDYQGIIDSQADDSPWDLVTKSLERTSNQYVCIQRAKVSSEWGPVERTQTTQFILGWDKNGGSKQCFFATTSRACGYYFGEPGSWDECLAQFDRGKGGLCNHFWVGGGHFISITNVTNAVPLTGIVGVSHWPIDCYGADGNDSSQLWQMDCHGLRYEDKFVCYSPSKGEQGEVLTNRPYDPTQYEGCEEIHWAEDSCAELAQREDCRLIREDTDGVLTVSNGVLTSARARPSCKSVKGAKTTITVCEPWWTKKRTYECDDVTDDWKKEQERAEHVTQNIQMGSDKLLVTVGDLTFGKDGAGVSNVIDMNLQFDNISDQCSPACVVQKEVPNYELIIPSAQGKLEADGSWHVEDQEASIVPSGSRVIMETVDCTYANNQYTCPVPDGWSMRAQCSCADGREFLQAISALSVINEVSKDFVCSSGKEAGVCDSGEEGTYVALPVCGKFSPTAGNLVEGTDYWVCNPKLWMGTKASDQAHEIYADDEFSCRARSLDLITEDLAALDMGPLRPKSAWFASSLPWAKEMIAKHVKETVGKDQAGQICDCAGPEFSIDICQPMENKYYACLSTSKVYSSLASCKSSCTGSATLSESGFLCVWKDGNENYDPPLPIKTEYNLVLNPTGKKTFGEVLLKLNESSDLVFTGSDVALCAKTGSASLPYQCTTTKQNYASLLACQEQCSIPAVRSEDDCKLEVTAGSTEIQKSQGSCTAVSMGPLTQTCNKPYNTLGYGQVCGGYKSITEAFPEGQEEVVWRNISDASFVAATGYSQFFITMWFYGTIGEVGYNPANTTVMTLRGSAGEITSSRVSYYSGDFLNFNNAHYQFIADYTFANGIRAHVNYYSSKYDWHGGLNNIEIKSSGTETVQFWAEFSKCGLNNQHYSTQAQCQAACYEEKIYCYDLNQYVASASQCKRSYYPCGLNGTQYPSQSACLDGCVNKDVCKPKTIPGQTEVRQTGGTCSQSQVPAQSMRSVVTRYNDVSSPPLQGFSPWHTITIPSFVNATGYNRYYIELVTMPDWPGTVATARLHLNGPAGTYTSAIQTMYYNLIIFSEGQTVYHADFQLPNGIRLIKDVYGHKGGWYGSYRYKYDEEDTVTVSATQHTCSETGTVYSTASACNTACVQNKMYCLTTNSWVNSEAECKLSGFECQTNGQFYSTERLCSESCPVKDAVELQTCLSSSDPMVFSLYLTPGGTAHGLNLEMVQKKEASEILLASKQYGEESVILQQCLDRYTNPYVLFDEPGTGAHFEFSMFDILAYRAAAFKGQLPHTNWELPASPAVYRGFGYTKPNTGMIEEVDEEGNIIEVPDPYLTPEEREELAKPPAEQTIVDENGNILAVVPQGQLVPNSPMFLAKNISIGLYEKKLRLGKIRAIGSNLVPYVYYYECPQGIVNATNSCSQQAPFGGIVETIAGRRCFQYLCDGSAEMETTSTQYSGCGLTNDGLRVE